MEEKFGFEKKRTYLSNRIVREMMIVKLKNDCYPRLYTPGR